MALNLVMMGPPGAGKGTQAERIASHWRIPKISTGDILREAVKASTELGVRAQAIMARGELVSDEIIIGIARERLAAKDAARGFVLDGFPRTVAQAEALDAIVEGRGPLLVLNIAVPDEVLVSRLTARRVCEACGANADPGQAGTPAVVCARCGGRMVQRADDREEVIRERLRVYARDTRPLLDFYRARSTFRAVDGAGTPERVAAALDLAIVEASGNRVGA